MGIHEFGCACDFECENVLHFILECPFNEHNRHTLSLILPICLSAATKFNMFSGVHAPACACGFECEICTLFLNVHLMSTRDTLFV